MRSALFQVIDVNTLIDTMLQDQTSAAWLQTVGVLLAAAVAAGIYARQAYVARKRERGQERRLVETALALAQEVRKLFHRGALACAAAGPLPAAEAMTALEWERQELSRTLISLPLERLPHAALLGPLLRLRRCLNDMARLTTAQPRHPGQLFAALHHRADLALAEIEAVRRAAYEKPRFPLRRRSEPGMPTTTVDRYATFRFPEEVYLEPHSVDFEVLVNNQSVRCTVSHDELDKLAAAARFELLPALRRYELVFRRLRESFQRAAENLIRAGARSPVVIRCSDVQASIASSEALQLASSARADMLRER